MVYHILHMLDDILIKLKWSASLHCTFFNQWPWGRDSIKQQKFFFWGYATTCGATYI